MKRIATFLIAGVLLITIQLLAGETILHTNEINNKVDSLNTLAANSLNASFIGTEQLADRAKKLVWEVDLVFCWCYSSDYHSNTPDYQDVH